MGRPAAATQLHSLSPSLSQGEERTVEAGRGGGPVAQPADAEAVLVHVVRVARLRHRGPRHADEVAQQSHHRLHLLRGVLGQWLRRLDHLVDGVLGAERLQWGSRGG